MNDDEVIFWGENNYKRMTVMILFKARTNRVAVGYVKKCFANKQEKSFGLLNLILK